MPENNSFSKYLAVFLTSLLTFHNRLGGTIVSGQHFLHTKWPPSHLSVVICGSSSKRLADALWFSHSHHKCIHRNDKPLLQLRPASKALCGSWMSTRGRSFSDVVHLTCRTPSTDASELQALGENIPTFKKTPSL